jgi:DNA repair photolyase
LEYRPWGSGVHFKEAKGILSPSNGMNICRGCVHGCIYCDSRSRCYDIQHDFEDVEIKINAPRLLEEKLRSKRQKCVIGTGSMSDPYMPLPESLAVTRGCLEIIDKYGFGLAIQTKSNLILRDLDLLTSINKKAKCVVEITLTTYDEDLCRIIEPKVSSTVERFEVLKTMRDSGIETVVWLCPFLPFINDTEENLRGILNYCVEAKVYGIICFGIGLTLRNGDREFFNKNLDIHFPGLKEKYQRKYGSLYQVMSGSNGPLMGIFHDFCEEHRILHDNNAIFNYMHTLEPERIKNAQMELF